MERLLCIVYYLATDAVVRTLADWHGAPYRGVQGIGYPDAHPPSDPASVGSRIITGDFYLLPEDVGHPVASDRVGLLDYLERTGRISETDTLEDWSLADYRDAGVKLGRTVADDAFGKLYQRMRSDPRLPRKSAFARGERRAG